MQQVGGSIGTSALSTIALTATTSYLVAHHTGALAQTIAAVHGYTLAFAVSAGLFGLGVILAITRCRPAAGPRNSGAKQRHPHPPRPWNPLPPPAPIPAPAPAMEPASRAGQGTRALRALREPASATHAEMHAIPVALLCCSPVMKPDSRSTAAPIL